MLTIYDSSSKVQGLSVLLSELSVRQTLNLYRDQNRETAAAESSRSLIVLVIEIGGRYPQTSTPR